MSPVVRLRIFLLYSNYLHYFFFLFFSFLLSADSKKNLSMKGGETRKIEIDIPAIFCQIYGSGSHTTAGRPNISSS